MWNVECTIYRKTPFPIILTKKTHLQKLQQKYTKKLLYKNTNLRRREKIAKKKKINIQLVKQCEGSFFFT